MLRFLVSFLLLTKLAAGESILIRGALLVDGTGTSAKMVSVRIEGDRIVAIGNLKPLSGDTIVDAGGMVLAPGFIDPHNHSIGVDKDPDAVSQISQGITTILLGQDGGSPLPVGPYLAGLREHPSALNVQLLVGHATVRRQVMGDDYRRQATPSEIARMGALVDEAMVQGAVGLSTGLEYEVGSYSTTEEVIALAKAAAKHQGIYVSHVRDEGDGFFTSLQEILRIGREASLPVQISHIKLGTAAVWGRAREVVSIVAKARAEGQDVSADCYPYDAWGSGITVLVLNKKYDDPVSVRKGLADVGGAANVTITSCKAHPEFEFRSLAEVSNILGATPEATFTRIVSEGGASVVVKAMKLADIRTFYRQPWVMVSSDGGIGMRHPRGALPESPSGLCS